MDQTILELDEIILINFLEPFDSREIKMKSK